MISGHTALYGLVAHPAQHSLSPSIQNQWFSEKKIDARYFALDSQASAVAVVQAIQTLGLAGINLSMPYKQALVPLITDLTPIAKTIGAINTIRNWEGQLSATSTDGDGFWQAFQKANPHQQVKRAVILGAGGAALALIEAAGRFGVQQLTLFKRQNQSYTAVKQQIEQIAAICHIHVQVVPYEQGDLLTRALGQADCVVNATNIGMLTTPGMPLTEQQLQAINQQAVVVDLIYAPRTTLFLKRCRHRQLRCQNGLGMLIEQAALSFQFWTGQMVTTDSMYQQLTKEF